MKSVGIDTLLELSADGVELQKEWSSHGSYGKSSMLLEIALFAGMIGPGLFIISYLIGFQSGFTLSLIIVALGYGVPHLAFLGRKARFWRAVSKPGRSWISRGFIFANLFLLFLLAAELHLIPLFASQLLWPGSPLVNGLLLAAFACAVLLTVYPGFLFSVLKAIPLWNITILIPLMMVQALGGGTALLLLLDRLFFFKVPWMGGLISLDALLIAVAGLLITLLLFAAHSSGEAGKVSLQLLLLGKYRRMFLQGALFWGGFIPLVLLMLAPLSPLPGIMAATAALLQLAGVFTFKYCLLNAGTYHRFFNEQITEKALGRSRG